MSWHALTCVAPLNKVIIPNSVPLHLLLAHVHIEPSCRIFFLSGFVMPGNNISLIGDSIVTTQNAWFFTRDFKMFWIPIILWGRRRNNCSPAASFANCVVTIPVKSASAIVYFYTNNSKMSNFELWLLSEMSHM